MNHSAFPPNLSKLIAKQFKEEYRSEHGVNPPSSEKLAESMIDNIKNMTPKDRAALSVRMAESDVGSLQNFRRTERELMEAREALRKAQRKYQETPGKETPTVLSLREKVCEVLDKDKTKVWLVRDLATLLGHPANHVGVVVSFLRKDPKKKWNVK